MLDDCTTYFTLRHLRALELLKSGSKRSSDPDIDEILSLVILAAEKIEVEEVDRLKSELQKEHLKEKRRQLTFTIKRAEDDGDENGLRSALEELKGLPSHIFES